jgi:hypothetical protein
VDWTVLAMGVQILSHGSNIKRNAADAVDASDCTVLLAPPTIQHQIKEGWTEMDVYV